MKFGGTVVLFWYTIHTTKKIAPNLGEKEAAAVCEENRRCNMSLCILLMEPQQKYEGVTIKKEDPFELPFCKLQMIAA